MEYKLLFTIYSYFFSEEEEDQLNSLDKEFNKIILNHDDSYVTVHPEHKLMEKYEGKLSTDVCLFQYYVKVKILY